MTRDFTIAAYGELVEAGLDSDFEFLTVRDSLRSSGRPERFVVLRRDNRDLWRGPDAAGFDAYDLLGEAYPSMDFTDVTYFSDTGRTWRDGEMKIKDHPEGDVEKPVQVSTTAELAALLRERRLPRVCILAHPERWARSLPELVIGQVRDSTVNTGNRLINIIS